MLDIIRKEVEEESDVKFDALFLSVEEQEKLCNEKEKYVDALQNMALKVHQHMGREQLLQSVLTLLSY